MDAWLRVCWCCYLPCFQAGLGKAVEWSLNMMTTGAMKLRELERTAKQNKKGIWMNYVPQVQQVHDARGIISAWWCQQWSWVARHLVMLDGYGALVTVTITSPTSRTAIREGWLGGRALIVSVLQQCCPGAGAVCNFIHTVYPSCACP